MKDLAPGGRFDSGLKMKLMGLGWVLLTGVVLGQGEWPEFRGPTGQGIGGKAPREWGEKQGVAWKIEVKARGWSSPVVSEGLVVLTGGLSEGGKTELVVSAYDFHSGEEVWSKKLFAPTEEELEAKHAKNGLASSTPVLRDGVVYVHFGHMGTAALKLKSGEVLWKQKLEYSPVHGGASSPILVGERMIISVDGASDPALMALDVKTGEVVWKTPRTEEVKQTFSFCTPLLVKDGEREVVISPASAMIGGYDPATGKELWKVTFKPGWSLVPRPVVMDGVVYVSTGFMKGTLLAIKLAGARGDVTDSHVLWSEEKNISETPSFVAAEGVVYVLSDSGALTCFDGKSGEIRWKEKLVGNFSASPVLAGGALYCETEDGVCYVVEASPKEGKVVFEVDLEDRIYASPAVVEGALLMRTETGLWKIDGGAGL